MRGSIVVPVRADQQRIAALKGFIHPVRKGDTVETQRLRCRARNRSCATTVAPAWVSSAIVYKEGASRRSSVLGFKGEPPQREPLSAEVSFKNLAQRGARVRCADGR